MAFVLHCSTLVTYLALFSLILSNFCYCFINPKLSKLESGSDWLPTLATWYGPPSGAGSEGGACGYQNAVAAPPFSSLITAAASSIYNSGMGCGICYQVKCTTSEACSGEPVTVVITDECPGSGCDSQSHLFDLSGTSFGTMAKPGRSDDLRNNVGIQQIQYRRVDCDFPGVTVAIRVDPGSNPHYFAAAILYVEGNGVAGLEIKQAADSGGAWLPMQHSWGAVWKVELPANYPGPFSIRLTGGGNSGDTLVAESVIPADYKPGETYRSAVNF